MVNAADPADPFANPPLSVETITDYDRANSLVYLRLLDADTDGADWREVAADVLNLDVNGDPERAHSVWAANLERARWMTVLGFRHLLTDAGVFPTRQI